MNSNRLWATTATLLALSSVGPLSSGVWAQTTSVASCPLGSNWSWNENSLGQDPCAISSQLDAACRGVGSYTIPALNSTQNYVPPQKDSTYDLECDCDTVMYSLYMACSTCQGGIIYSWTKWIAQCDTVYVTQYPHDIPYGTAVPHWAFYDVTTLPNQTYSDTVAMSVGKDPEATAKPLSTATYKTGTSTNTRFGSTSTSAFGSNSTGKSNSGSTRRTPIAAIVGGVVGGIVVIVTGIIAAVVISQQNKRKRNQPPLQPLPSQDMVDYQKVQPMSPMSPGATLYNQPPAQNFPYNAPQTLPYNPSTSPGITYTTPASPGAPYNVPTSPSNPPYNLSTSPNPQPTGQNPASGYYYNPEDPTTFPPPMGDGQSSVTYTNNTTTPAGPGRYGGMPEL